MSDHAKTPRFKRQIKNYFLMPRYQLRYSGLVNAVAIAILVMTYTSVKSLYANALAACADAGISNFEISTDVLAFSILFLVISTAFGIYFSHRTAGPMYRFSQVFKAVKNGNYSERVHLRPSDDFQDVAVAFNEAMDRLQSEIESKKN